MPEELAINGGLPLRKTYYPSWPQFDEEAIDIVRRVLKSGNVNYWTGEEGRAFEQEFASLIGVEYAVAFANGTLALEAALEAIGVGEQSGAEVVVTPRTFIASVSSIVRSGAIPVFADVDSISQNITAQSIAKVITPRTKAIVVVHLAGWPANMPEIMELARSKGLLVIEDCAQAHGARYAGKSVGAYGDLGIYSFCQDKIITTGGEGGIVVTNSFPHWRKVWSLKDHGKSYEAVFERSHPKGFRWLHESFGSNYRMTEMQSALGRVLLKKLPEFVEKRRENARILNECCSEFKCLRVTIPDSNTYHSYYKYYVFVVPEMLKTGWSRDLVRDAICAEGIPCDVGSCSEVYKEKAFSENLRPKQDLPIAKTLGETALMFYVHPTLANSDIMDTCSAIRKVFGEVSK